MTKASALGLKVRVGYVLRPDHLRVRNYETRRNGKLPY